MNISDLLKLSVPAKTKDPNDYRVDLFDAPTSNGAGMTNLLVGDKNKYKVVKDPYSGKFLGESDPKVFIQKFQQTISGLQKNLEYYQNTKNIMPLRNPSDLSVGMSSLGIGLPLTTQQRQQKINELSSQLTERQSQFKDFQETGYELQEDKFFQSYDLYQEGWNDFLKARYQNPRIAEEQRNKTVRGQREYESAVAQPTGAVSTNSRVTKRQVGTGIGTSTFNPFGSLEAGLGV